MEGVIHMSEEFDCKAAYETLEQAMQEAGRILRRARLQTVLKRQLTTQGENHPATPQETDP